MDLEDGNATFLSNMLVFVLAVVVEEEARRSRCGVVESIFYCASLFQLRVCFLKSAQILARNYVRSLDTQASSATLPRLRRQGRPFVSELLIPSAPY